MQSDKESMDEEIQLTRSIIQWRCALVDIIKLLEIKETTKRSITVSSPCAYLVSKIVTALALVQWVRTPTETQWRIQCTISNGRNIRQLTTLNR